jgi:hypothetical protein
LENDLCQFDNCMCMIQQRIAYLKQMVNVVLTDFTFNVVLTDFTFNVVLTDFTYFQPASSLIGTRSMMLQAICAFFWRTGSISGNFGIWASKSIVRLSRRAKSPSSIAESIIISLQVNPDAQASTIPANWASISQGIFTLCFSWRSTSEFLCSSK